MCIHTLYCIQLYHCVHLFLVTSSIQQFIMLFFHVLLFFFPSYFPLYICIYSIIFLYIYYFILHHFLLSAISNVSSHAVLKGTCYILSNLIHHLTAENEQEITAGIIMTDLMHCVWVSLWK